MKNPQPDAGHATGITFGWVMAVAVLVGYGSLYPFDFSERTLADAFRAWVGARMERPSRGDLAANLLLYAPLGAVISAYLTPAARRWRALAALLAGLVLSFALETLQWLSPSRVASIADIAANTSGAGLGAIAWEILRSRSSELGLPQENLAPGAGVGIALAAAWLLARSAPWVPTIDMQKYRSALAPLWHGMGLDGFGVVRHFGAWLVLALALRHGLRSGKPERGMLASLMALVLAAQILIVGRALRWAEPAGMGLALLVAASAGSIVERRAAAWTAGLVCAVVLVTGLQPFAFVPEPQRFVWIPFHGALSGNPELALASMLEKIFFAAALLWLLMLAGVNHRGATLGALALFAGVELAQRWLPGRTPEITDPLLVVLLSLAMARVGRHAGRSPRRTDAAQA